MLSFNWEPNTATEFLLTPEQHREFNEQLQLAVAHLEANNLGRLNVPGNYNLMPQFVKISLPRFATWALSVAEWKVLPPELKALAQKPTAATSEATKKAAPTTQSDDWRKSARDIADECFDNDTNAKPKVRDSLKGYSSRVMDKMQERKIHSSRGLINNPKTIQREAPGQ